MKNIRVFYRKNGPLKFVSHLDMYRLVCRLLRRTRLPIWYTEGFNSRPYVAFALPLSLGFTSNYECFDFRLEQETHTCNEIKKLLQNTAPPGFEVLKVAEPQNKPGKIAAAEFLILLPHTALLTPLQEFLSQTEINVQKKTKKGALKNINLAPKIQNYSLTKQNATLQLCLTLPAGSEENINPTLLLEAFEAQVGQPISYTVTRTMLFTADGAEFV